jgi:hypothetical protein
MRAYRKFKRGFAAARLGLHPQEQLRPTGGCSTLHVRSGRACKSAPAQGVQLAPPWPPGTGQLLATRGGRRGANVESCGGTGNYLPPGADEETL